MAWASGAAFAAGCGAPGDDSPVALLAGAWVRGDASGADPQVALELRADGTYTHLDPALDGGRQDGFWLADASTLTLTDDAADPTSVVRTYHVNDDVLGLAARLPVTQPAGVIGAWTSQVRVVQRLEALAIVQSTLETRPDGTASVTVSEDGEARAEVGTFAEVEPGRLEVTTGPDGAPTVLRVHLVDRVIIDDDALFVRAGP